MGFFRLKSTNLADQRYAGEGIMAVSRTAFNGDPNSEWAKFDADTRKWLHDHHYRYINADGTLIGDNGKIPAEIEIVPVYDTPTRMHVRVPWREEIDEAAQIPVLDEMTYNSSFPALLSRYFMRKCR